MNESIIYTIYSIQGCLEGGEVVSISSNHWIRVTNQGEADMVEWFMFLLRRMLFGWVIEVWRQ